MWQPNPGPADSGNNLPITKLISTVLVDISPGLQFTAGSLEGRDIVVEGCFWERLPSSRRPRNTARDTPERTARDQTETPSSHLRDPPTHTCERAPPTLRQTPRPVKLTLHPNRHSYKIACQAHISQYLKVNWATTNIDKKIKSASILMRFSKKYKYKKKLPFKLLVFIIKQTLPNLHY